VQHPPTWAGFWTPHPACLVFVCVSGENWWIMLQPLHFLPNSLWKSPIYTWHHSNRAQTAPTAVSCPSPSSNAERRLKCFRTASCSPCTLGPLHTGPQVPTCKPRGTTKICLIFMKSNLDSFMQQYSWALGWELGLAFCSTQLATQVSRLTSKNCCHVGIHVIVGT
jgi:hypothetical protein